ncbi:MAG: restriction endonuclease [Agriterribacter sp.]
MKRWTIRDAILETFNKVNKPLTAKEIYNYLNEQDLYQFKTENPVGVVKVAIRRHCEGLDFPSAKPEKYFKLLRDGRYWLNNISVPGISQKEIKSEVEIKKDIDHLKAINAELTVNHKEYIEAVQKQVLNNLKQLTPIDFEVFSKKFLEVYGFSDMVVTQATKDGGIDGYGRLKVGIAHLDVAFQSKRWNNTPVPQKEIQSFRGSISGKCEQGIYFTTSTYTKGAKDVSIQKGAVPVILIDGNLMVDIMMDKGFGVEVELLRVYSINLENIFEE